MIPNKLNINGKDVEALDLNKLLNMFSQMTQNKENLNKQHVVEQPVQQPVQQDVKLPDLNQLTQILGMFNKNVQPEPKTKVEQTAKPLPQIFKVPLSNKPNNNLKPQCAKVEQNVICKDLEVRKAILGMNKRIIELESQVKELSTNKVKTLKNNKKSSNGTSNVSRKK